MSKGTIKDDIQSSIEDVYNGNRPGSECPCRVGIVLYLLFPEIMAGSYILSGTDS
jgi:hypothetical protein